MLCPQKTYRNAQHKQSADGDRAMQAWIEAGDLPSAIRGVNDAVGSGDMRSLAEAGLRIGEDVAVIGSGNIHHGDMLNVPLTTVSWPRSEMGQAAAKLLIQSIESNSCVAGHQKVILPPTVIVRRSCGAKSAKAAVRN